MAEGHVGWTCNICGFNSRSGGNYCGRDDCPLKIIASIPSAPDNEWTCGHVAGSACGQCYQELAAKAHELQMEVDRLRDKLRYECN